MCGYIGFVGKNKGTQSGREHVLSDMLAQIAHRGPDSEDLYVDDEVALGFRRLSIIDLSTGNQPIYNEDKTKVLIFNGEIYNYQSLREELIKCGHTFYTHTDSEVLVHGYEEYGSELLQKLRGMFSFVIWDTKNKKLFAARDYFGIKPLYYAPMGETFMFGSEIKGFLKHPDFKKELREEKLSEYLTFSCISGADTFFKNVYKLLPGHFLEYENSELKITRYFTPEFAITHDKSMEGFSNEISKEFTGSVQAHEIADVEVGCFLSSGVDSSYVAREVSKTRRLRTYTIGFEDKKYDESDDVITYAKEIGVENKRTLVSSEDYFANVGNVQYHLDEPLANPSANLLYFVSKLAAEDVKVVLSGEGADEMFGGYNVYKEPIMMATYRKIPKFIRRIFAECAKILPDFKGKNMLIRGAGSVRDWYIGNSNIYSESEKKKVLKTYQKFDPQFLTSPFYDKVANQDEVSQMQYVDIHFWMVQEILLKADKMSMAHSLELRVPFLDKEIWNLSRTIPVEFKVNKDNTKLALRKAAGRDMNATNANRTKMAFPLPLPEWLREDRYFEKVTSYFTNDIAGKYFDQNELMNILNEHKNGGRNNARRIWTVFTFLVWYEEYFIKR
ncbi:MAG: asparagine synthase (glutamine-hydrolyzing) [bacterium]